ncbi:unnamed protein product, partial [Closterium sp. NIES-53]
CDILRILSRFEPCCSSSPSLLAHRPLACPPLSSRPPADLLTQLRHPAHAIAIRAVRAEPALRHAIRHHPRCARHWRAE